MGLDNLEDSEYWRPIKNFENSYLVSRNGEIYSKYVKRLLKFDKTKDNYFSIKLQKNGNSIHTFVHKLVAESFLPLPDSNNIYEVDHIDNNRQNNCVENLRWVTHKENLEKSFLLKNQRRNKKIVVQYNLNGNIIKTYPSVNEAFRQTGIRHISECALEKRKTAGGYKWKYLNERSDDLSD